MPHVAADRKSADTGSQDAHILCRVLGVGYENFRSLMFDWHRLKVWPSVARDSRILQYFLRLVNFTFFWWRLIVLLFKGGFWVYQAGLLNMSKIQEWIGVLQRRIHLPNAFCLILYDLYIHLTDIADM
jgi:hypothetical protein